MRSKILFVFLLVFSLAFASASFELGEPNNTISTNYALGSFLSGGINISLDSEPLTSLFQNNLGNSISLKDLLNTSANSGFSYACNTPECKSTYAASTPTTQKEFILNEGESETIGFQIGGIISEITSLDFNVMSTADTSCTNQLKIDLLDDGISESGNTKQSTETCGEKNYSCFNMSKTSLESTVGSTPFCQRVTLDEAPGFEVGAWLKEDTAGSKKFNMVLYSLIGNNLTSCELDWSLINSTGSEVSCSIKYLVTEPTDYYLCLVPDEGDGSYLMRGQSPVGEKCGFNNIPPGDHVVAYQIFFQKSKFSAVGTVAIENELSSQELLSTKIKNYIINTYDSLDCSEFCLIPLKITSNVDQTIIVKDLELKYDQIGLSGVINSNFHNFSTAPAKITSPFQNLLFDGAEFFLFSSPGYRSYKLFFNQLEVYNGNFSMKNISITISPTEIPVSFPTVISAEINSENEIVSYSWDFGDGATQTTTIPEVEHTYSEKGEFNLVLEITDVGGIIFSKSETITVNISKEIIDSKIAELESKIISLESQMNSLGEFTKKMLGEYIGLDETKTILEEIKTNYSLDENDTSFILTLINLDLPEGFLSVPTSQIAYYPSESTVNLAILETIQGESYTPGEEEAYVNSILAWFQNNIDATIMINEILIDEGEGNTAAFRIFSIDISKKGTLSEDPDVVIRELGGLTFKNSFAKESTNGYTHFKLGTINHLEIYTTENIDFIQLPFFISPSLSSVFTSTIPDVEGTKEKDWRIFAAIILGVLILGVIAYFIIGNWYKRKYENKLFPNKNNFFNMITYVNNSKKKGMKNSEIRKNLSKVGWSSEQISYVMKKYAGKNTGVPGINANKLPK